MKHATVLALTTMGVCTLGSATAQDPPCLIDDDGNADLQYVWGGESRGVAVRVVETDQGTQERVWVAEDGGRIRYSDDGGSSWTFQATPAGADHTLLDIWFLDDGERGWACGKGGRLLATVDHGTTWTLVGDASCGTPQDICNEFGEPAVLWGVYFMNATEGFVVGEQVFKVTTDGGATWCDVDVFQDAAGTIQLDRGDMEFYRLHVIDTGSGFIGNCAAEWEDNTPSGDPEGVNFHAEWTSFTCANPGKWSITLQSTEAEELWDVDFEDTPLTGDSYLGFIVAGTGSGPGYFFTSTDSGRANSWTQEFQKPGTNHCGAGFSPDPGSLYAVTAAGGGTAWAVGYAGSLYERVGAEWVPMCAPGFTAPVLGVDSLGPDDVWAVGSFGFQRRTDDGGLTWDSANPPYVGSEPEELWRLDDVHFFDDQEGVVVGQFQRIARTLDGGCSWTEEYGGQGVLSGTLTAVSFADHDHAAAVGGSGSAAYLDPVNNGAWMPATFNNITNPQLRDVDHAAGDEYWAVGSKGTNPVLVQSTDGGATWTSVATPSGVGVELEGVTFVDGKYGFVVGQGDGFAKAWLVIDGPNLSFIDVSPAKSSPAGGIAGELLAVDARGSTIYDEVIAVGRDGMIVAWDRPSAQFVGIDDAYELQPDGTVMDQITQQWLTAVALPAGELEVLIGAQHLDSAAYVLDAGKMVRFDGIDWGTVRARSMKSVQGISMLSGTRGFVLGRPMNDPFAPPGSGPDSSNMNDSVLLLYDSGS